jgi:NADH-quinone oxidoreductase subunit E
MSHSAPSAASRGPREWSSEQSAEIEMILTRYPTKKAAVMPLLWMAQDAWDWIDLDIMRLIGRTLDLPPSHVHAVASFYTMFKKSPTNKYFFQVCHTLSCALVGAEGILAHLEKRLELDEHGNSKDGLFSVLRVECLASCGSGPMAQLNEHFYERLTPEIIDQVIDALRAGKPLPEPRREADQWIFPVS